MSDKSVSTQWEDEGKSVWRVLDDVLLEVDILRRVQGAFIDDLLRMDFNKESSEYNKQLFSLLHFVAEAMAEKLVSISTRLDALMCCDGVKTVFCHSNKNK